MIVRDGAATLADCLASVAPIADELIVVDTGSRDDTVDIARRFGADVHAIPWTDDFAAARNHYLEIARMPWILSLDADERLPSVDRNALRATLAANPDTAFGVTVRNYFHHGAEWPLFLAPSEFGGRASDELSWSISRTVRLFPRKPGVSYRYPVHESLIPAALERGLRLELSSITIHHRERSATGRVGPSRKASLYRALGVDKVHQYPGYFRGHLELARVYMNASEWDLAEYELYRCLRLNPLSMSAHYSLGLTMVETDRWRELSRLTARAPLRHIDRGYLEGLRLLRARRHERGLSELRQVLAEKPAYLPARKALEGARARGCRRRLDGTALVSRRRLPTGR